MRASRMLIRTFSFPRPSSLNPHPFFCVPTPINYSNKTMSTGAPCARFYHRKFTEFVGVKIQHIGGTSQKSSSLIAHHFPSPLAAQPIAERADFSGKSAGSEIL